MIAEVAGAAELGPGESHFAESDTAKTSSAQAITDLERLPKMLVQAAIVEVTKGQVVERVLSVMGGIMPGLRLRHAKLARSVEQ